MKPVLALLTFVSLLHAEGPIRGFAPATVDAEHRREEKAIAVPDPVRMRSYAKRMSERPHIAGSPASKAVADYVLSLFKSFGLDASIERFDALLPYPTVRVVELTAPVRYRARLQEPAVAGDKDSANPAEIPPYNAYSADGDVTAPLVYVNYGIPEDYDALAKMGIDVRGKIAIARYGKSWRGTKPKVAAERGAIACIIYSDPRDDGYFQGDVYPKGPFRPAGSAQRGSVMDMPLYVGDPLTPGWASEAGARRLPVSESHTLMKIPVLPISYEDARPLLENLGGPVAPEPWRGALPITYHIGPGPAVVHMKVASDWTQKPVYNVVATIPGTSLADEWVVYGNHHDAWGYGASDPVSGAAVVLETARTLAEMVKDGWQPKRTIKLALWDAEEFGMVGSTEWAEKHLAELDRKAAVYLNTDSNGRGVFGGSGSPSLQSFLSEVLRDLKDPVSGAPLLEGARRRGETQQNTRFSLGALGAGSDFVAFIHHGGIASLNVGFSGDSAGVYHSIYDSWNWFTKFSDGDFVYGKALTQVMSTALMRLAGSSVLPFEFGAFTGAVKGYVDELEKLAGEKVPMGEVRAALDEVVNASAAYEKALQSGLPKVDSGKLAAINEAVFRTERSLTLPEGLPGREWYKHQIAAPGIYTGYSAKSLPGIREAVEAGRWTEAREQSAQVAKVLRALAAQIGKATALVSE